MWQPLSYMPGYEINRDGEVRLCGTWRLVPQSLHPTAKGKGPYISVQLDCGTRAAHVANLMDETFGPGSAVQAGLPAPDLAKAQQVRANGGHTRAHGKRRCHDCGKPTTNYRCDVCWRKRRGFAEAGESSWMEDVL